MLATGKWRVSTYFANCTFIFIQIFSLELIGICHGRYSIRYVSCRLFRKHHLVDFFYLQLTAAIADL